jgi:hypothetical protein
MRLLGVPISRTGKSWNHISGCHRLRGSTSAVNFAYPCCAASSAILFAESHTAMTSTLGVRFCTRQHKRSPFRTAVLPLLPCAQIRTRSHQRLVLSPIGMLLRTTAWMYSNVEYRVRSVMCRIPAPSPRAGHDSYDLLKQPIKVFRETLHPNNHRKKRSSAFI